MKIGETLGDLMQRRSRLMMRGARCSRRCMSAVEAVRTEVMLKGSEDFLREVDMWRSQRVKIETHF